MAQVKSQRAPEWLQKILKFDETISKKFVIWGNSWAPLHNLRIHYRALELTCHGIPWLAFWIAFTWIFNTYTLVELQVNIILGLIIDIIFVGLIKAFARRRRPIGNKNDAIAEYASDKFSFPSGHCSRAALITFIFTTLWPLPIIFYPSLFAWTIAICLSRLLMERHYILDVVGGVILGILEGFLLALFWLNNEHSKWLLSFISDEKIDGGDYHV